MSNSFFEPADIPAAQTPPPFDEAVGRFHAAMYAANDCLRRASDGIDASDPANINSDYTDRQLLLAGQYVEKARIAVELLRRAIAVNLQRPETLPTNEPNRGRPMFPSEGPYQEGR